MNDQAPDISQSEFLEWRVPRRGISNPQIVTNTLWTWLIDNRISAYAINEKFHGPSPFHEGPGWCFDRFGRSETILPDGRVVYVAGEHEDYYDPDFYIYNDVVVVDPAGTTVIYAYPAEHFPPTDFHSATLAGDSLILIGNLGYPENRLHGHTQVVCLDLKTWAITKIQTSGEAPGWISRHNAALTPDGCHILVTGGVIDRRDEEQSIDNIENWNLDLATWHWTRLTHRPWPRFEVHRETMGRNHLWQLRHYQWAKQVAWHDLEEQERKLTQDMGGLPDLALLTRLYAPACATQIPGEDEDDHRIHRIHVGDTIVRYAEGSFVIQVTVEGELPAEIVRQLQQDLVEKLSALERAPVVCRTIAPQ